VLGISTCSIAYEPQPSKAITNRCSALGVFSFGAQATAAIIAIAKRKNLFIIFIILKYSYKNTLFYGKLQSVLATNNNSFDKICIFVVSLHGFRDEIYN
jgi:hypothetical protein